MGRALFADEPAAELLKYGMRPHERAMKALDGITVPVRVRGVLAEWRRHRHPEGLLPDRDVNTEPLECSVKLPVEVCDRQTLSKQERAGLVVESLTTS